MACPWCKKTTYMQANREDALRLWDEISKEDDTKKEEEAMEERQGIVYINTEEIYPHPENPRKDLGDLAELAESIKKNGVMQNLTVMRGHWLTDKEWKGVSEEYSRKPTESLRRLLNERWAESGYTLLIGHRRCAAAKRAGIAELPCRIVDGVGRKEQLSIMLEENMQRNDLTIYEQAQGFQLMLDLGETEDTIAEKTGFSKSTIRHRLNIAKLDQEVVKEKEKDDYFQLSLKDLYALEKVPDIKKRNEILKNASDSRNLAWRAQAAADEIKRDKAAREIITELTKLGIGAAPKKAENEQWSGKWDKVKEFALDKSVPEKIAVRGKVKEMFYLRYGSAIRVIKKAVKKEKELTPYELERQKVDRIRKQVKEMQKELTADANSFVKAVVDNKVEPLKPSLELYEEIWRAILETDGYFTRSYICNVLRGKNEYELTGEEREAVKEEIHRMPVIHQMLCQITGNIGGELADYNGKYVTDRGRKHKAQLDILKKWGFTLTDEQERLVDGTHILYIREENEDDES